MTKAPYVIKITDLTEVRLRTVHYKDAFGNRHREQEEYTAKRPVRSIAPGPRFAHYMADWIVLYGIGTVIFLGTNLLVDIIVHYSPLLAQMMLICMTFSLLLFFPLFYVVCEYAWQKTPGKFLTKSVVIDEYGNKPSLRTIILRTLIRWMPLNTYSYLGDKYNHSHGWHDEWSKTWVVTEEELTEIRRLQAEQNIQIPNAIRPGPNQ